MEAELAADWEECLRNVETLGVQLLQQHYSGTYICNCNTQSMQVNTLLISKYLTNQKGLLVTFTMLACQYVLKAELNPLNIKVGLISSLDTFSNAQTYPKVSSVSSHHTTDNTWWK
mgnify:CR=1 FL=1